jgi:hypothetical protein
MPDRILVSPCHFVGNRQVFWLHRPTNGLPTALGAAVAFLLLIGFLVFNYRQGGVTAAGPLLIQALLHTLHRIPYYRPEVTALGDRLPWFDTLLFNYFFPFFYLVNCLVIGDR